MKAKQVIITVCLLTAVGGVGFVSAPRKQNLVVHEWGTFTSLQGSDGVPLKWNPLESSKLPGFVYNWIHPGLGRRATGMLALGAKNVLVTLQRMETPVVYFYTPRETSVDLTVRFPQGGITEWYPQAAEVGPSTYLQSPVIDTLDSGLHHVGVASSFSLGSVFKPETVNESLIHWPAFKIIPVSGHEKVAQDLAQDSSGSHYFAARGTDSALVELSHTGEANSSAQYEKFLFYRGVGNFGAPLHVEMQEPGVVTVSNCGIEPLAHLFILRIQGDYGELCTLKRLNPGEQRAESLDKAPQALAVVGKEIQAAMAHALEAEGLYRREAAAMVKTWEDSWFAEPGVRVLYVLPRSWTDQTLPMTIEPKPKEVVRVMVGRAELISTETEKQLTHELTRAAQNEAAAKQQLGKTVRELGRFAQPAFDRALDRADLQPSDRDRVRTWFYEIRNANR